LVELPIELVQVLLAEVLAREAWRVTIGAPVVWSELFLALSHDR
jgi:hypothetical protein